MNTERVPTSPDAETSIDSRSMIGAIGSLPVLVFGAVTGMLFGVGPLGKALSGKPTD